MSEGRPESRGLRKMATAAASSASEPEVEPQAGPEAEEEEDEAKAPSVERKVLSRAVAAEAAKTKEPGWDLQQEGVSESDGDEEDAMASSAESSPGEDEWEYDEEEEKNQLEIERLEEQVGWGGQRTPLGCADLARPLVLRGMETSEVASAQSPIVSPASARLWRAQCFASVVH